MKKHWIYGLLLSTLFTVGYLIVQGVPKDVESWLLVGIMFGMTTAFGTFLSIFGELYGRTGA